jgi:hypothetical protein
MLAATMRAFTHMASFRVKCTVTVIVVIAAVHCDNRLASAIAMGLFATGVAASVLLIAAHDRPFTGQISIGPQPLLQIMPDNSASR